MKNIAIGCASGQTGKRQVHGVAGEVPTDWNAWPAKEPLMEMMADSAKATCDYFGKYIVFLNVLRRMSVDCDCAGTRAAAPTIPDIRIYWRWIRHPAIWFSASRTQKITISSNVFRAATACVSSPLWRNSRWVISNMS